MTQKINLIHALPRLKKLYLPSKQIQKIWIFCAGLMLVYSGFLYIQDKQDQEKIQALKLTQQTKIAMLTSLSQQLPKGLKASDSDLKTLSQEVEHHEKLLTILQAKGTQNTTGFSVFLTAFAHLITPGTWLTSIKISDNGSRFLLKGKSESTDQTFRFLNRLDDSPTFNPVQFKLKDLKKVSQKEVVFHQFTLEASNAS